MKLFILTALLLFVAVAHTSGRRVCGNVFVWRHNNITCPENVNVVCADVFETTRNWYNGTTCDERRVLHNCMCPGNTVCPVTNDSHKIYASRIHTRYTCQSKCSLGWCANDRDAFPLTTVPRAPEFGNRNYNMVGCLCPRHHTPSTSPGIHRTVRAYGHEWSAAIQGYLMRYVCNGYQRNMGNPCDS